ncbi:hypothetical protein [Enhygromyxa salina]|uniref:hypothetical protein n=1 Tax=Enhygromyxa salina TaxID=215803 RepID=UPI0015E7B8FB|nr:hypothetical protein [Enhygromyxa salina]
MSGGCVDKDPPADTDTNGDGDGDGDGDGTSESSGIGDGDGDPPGDGDGDPTGDGDGDVECDVPNDESKAGAITRPIQFVNTSEAPVFLVPDTCTKSLVTHTEIGGVPTTHQPLVSCQEYAQGECGHCDEDYFLVPPIRIDPGASFTWSFLGYVYDETMIPDCPACFDVVQTCKAGRQLVEGDMIELRIQTAIDCTSSDDPAYCECAIDDACDLSELEYAHQANFGALTDIDVSFDLIADDPFVVELP